MKASYPDGGSWMEPEPHAFFLHAGAYSSFVLLTMPSEGGDLFASMDADALWGNDCVQLTESAVFFSVGSDAVNQAIGVYLDAPGRSDPPERRLQATFSSQGEQVYLESLIDMTFGEYCDQFHLPAGDYAVELLSWNLERARDNFDADPNLFFENVHHELHFNGPLSYLSPGESARTDRAGNMLPP